MAKTAINRIMSYNVHRISENIKLGDKFNNTLLYVIANYEFVSVTIRVINIDFINVSRVVEN